MKPVYAAFVLIAVAAADVSHLHNFYLPPKSGNLDFAASEQQQQQQFQYDEQGNEAHQFIGAGAYTPEHLIEPSNNLAADKAQQYPVFSSVGIEQGDAGASPHLATAEETQYVEQQPAAQEFVPQTYGPSIIYGDVPAAGVGQQAEENYYESTAASSGIETQYGSNGGYVY